MSLIIDSLKKIRSSSPATGKSSVPPTLLNLSPKGGKKTSPALIVLLIVSLLGLGIIFFLPTGESDYVVTQDPPSSTVQPGQNNAPAETPAQPQAPVVSDPAALATPADDTPNLADVQEPLPMPITPPQYDPTAANKQRILAMNALPEVSRQIKTIMPGATPLPKDTKIPQIVQNAMPQLTSLDPLSNPIMPDQPATAQPAQPAQPVVVQQAKPITANVLSGKAKEAFNRKIDYNTRFSQAAAAFQQGDNRKAEEIYTQLMQEKPTKEGLNNLLMSKVRLGRLNELVPTVDHYRLVADTSIISNAALEMNKLGMSLQALSFLSNYTDMPGNGQVYYAAGIIQESTNNMARAETAFEKALDASPADPYFLFAAARNKDEQKKYTEALKLYSKILQVPASDNIRKSAKARSETLAEYLENQKQEAQQPASK